MVGKTNYQVEVIHNFLLDKFGDEYLKYLLKNGEGENLIKDPSFENRYIYNKERTKTTKAKE